MKKTIKGQINQINETMKRTLMRKRGISLSLVVAFFVFLASCSEKDKIDFTSTDSKSVQSESESEAYSDEATDMSTLALGGMTDAQYAGSRSEDVIETLKLIDGRFKCATVTITRTGTKDAPKGTIVIDFGTSGDCKDPRGNSRVGKIIVTYNGRRFIPGSTIATTFDGYAVNGVKVEGVHTLTNVSPTTNDYPKFNITIVGGKVTFLDGTTITREQNMTREWQRAASPADDAWVVTGSASGKNRDDKTYAMEITKDLVYKRSCAISSKVFIAVEGTKVFTTDTKQITIDYGDGTCDNKVTVTINGKSKEVDITDAGS